MSSSFTANKFWIGCEYAATIALMAIKSGDFKLFLCGFNAMLLYNIGFTEEFAGLAAENGELEMLKCLLTINAPLNLNALFHAIYNGHIETTIFLLKNYFPDKFSIAFGKAVWSYKFNLCIQLVNHGYEISKQNGKSLLKKISTFPRKDSSYTLMKLLVSSKCKISDYAMMHYVIPFLDDNCKHFFDLIKNRILSIKNNRIKSHAIQDILWTAFNDSVIDNGQMKTSIFLQKMFPDHAYSWWGYRVFKNTIAPDFIALEEYENLFKFQTIKNYNGQYGWGNLPIVINLALRANKVNLLSQIFENSMSPYIYNNQSSMFDKETSSKVLQWAIMTYDHKRHSLFDLRFQEKLQEEHSTIGRLVTLHTLYINSSINDHVILWEKSVLAYAAMMPMILCSKFDKDIGGLIMTYVDTSVLTVVGESMDYK
jgi:hypothetical protein